jgi:hypothetical protein
MTAYEKLQAEQSRLYDQLERYELSGDTGSAQKVIARIQAVETTMSNLDIEESTASAPVAQAQPVTVSAINETKENDMATKVADVVTLESIGVEQAVVTKAQIGVEAFKRPFAGQAMKLTEKGEILFAGQPVAFPVEDSDIFLLQGPASKLTKANRVHLEQREDVKRAARGLALLLGGAVQADGSVSNGAGSVYQVIDGQCFKIAEFSQVNYDGSKTTIRQPEACKGLVDPKTGNATMRCKHQWALEFAAGAFVTCSRKYFHDVIAAEMGSIIGDDEANDWAKAKFAEWREKGEVRQLGRVAVAQAINDARNTGNVDANGLIPAALSVLDLKFGSQTLRELIVASGGKLVSARFDVQVPVGDSYRTVPMRTRAARNIDDFASAAAPIVAAAKRGGKDLVVTGFTA